MAKQQEPDLFDVPIHKNFKLWIPFCLTLGLAPFFPEPHLWGKLKWIAGGAVGMQPMDWADALMHGAPWIMLLVAIGFTLKDKFSGKKEN